MESYKPLNYLKAKKELMMIVQANKQKNQNDYYNLKLNIYT